MALGSRQDDGDPPYPGLLDRAEIKNEVMRRCVLTCLLSDSYVLGYYAWFPRCTGSEAQCNCKNQQNNSSKVTAIKT